MSQNAATTTPRGIEPTHPCIRCGREGVPADAGLCEQCNPLELSQPSATQMHGIAAVGIVLFIVVLAVAGRAFISGIGPFGASVLNVVPTGDALAVSIEVANEGSSAASTTCYVTESSGQIGGPRQAVQSPLVQPGQSVQFTATLTQFGNEAAGLAIDCPSP